MLKHDWINELDGEKDKFEKKSKGGQSEETVAKTMKEEKIEYDQKEAPTVIELKGERFDPLNIIAVLALVDISGKKREIPIFFHLKKPVTIIGTARRATVRLDDIKTIEGEHAGVTYNRDKFYIYPQQGKVILNGVEVSKEGKELENGSVMQIGSAKFVFLKTIFDRKGF